MADTVFLAGASGAIGMILGPLLVANGYDVYGSTRRAERAPELAALGVRPVVVDMFDADGLTQALGEIRPRAVIHQLTALPRGLDPAKLQTAIADNARIRDEGTRHLVNASIAAGVERLVAQSIAWAYRPGTAPYDEAQPLDVDAPEPRAITIRGVVSLEQQVLGAPMQGTVLRYGRFYGPGTGSDIVPSPSAVHVEAAAWAAVLALRHDGGGVFNVAEAGSDVTNAHARDVLGWDPGYRVAR